MAADDLLLSAQTALQTAVTTLLRPSSVHIDRDKGPTETLRLPSLLAQLAEAAESSTSRGGAARVVYRAPASLDVLGLLGEIDRETLWGLRASGDRRAWLSTGLGPQLRAWAALAPGWRAGTPMALRHSGRARYAQNYLLDAAGRVQRWVTRTEQILSPETATFEAHARPCPRCGNRTAFVWSDELGERVQRSALFFDKPTTTVRCRAANCGSVWGADLFGFLGALLAETPHETETV